MFFFGEPEDSAKVFWEGAVASPGPELPDCHFDEMEEQDLLNCLTYCRMAADRAIASPGVDSSVIDILVSEFDKVFEAAVNNSPRFRANFINGIHIYLGGYEKENINKYRALAKLPPLAN